MYKAILNCKDHSKLSFYYTHVVFLDINAIDNQQFIAQIKILKFKIVELGINSILCYCYDIN